jgi:hypothetical protein
MKSLKCNGCGLVNLASDAVCRRCKQVMSEIPLSPVNFQARMPVPQNGFSFFPFAMVAVLAVAGMGVVYAVYRSVSGKHDQQAAAVGKNLEAVTPVPRPTFDPQQVQEYGQDRVDQLRNFQEPKGLVDTRKLNEQGLKAIQPALDRMQKQNAELRDAAARNEQLRIASNPPPPR